MKRLLIDILNHLDRIPNLNELLPNEMELSKKMKDEGVLSHLFIKSDNTGAILVMDGVDIDKAKELLKKFPMSAYFEKVDFM